MSIGIARQLQQARDSLERCDWEEAYAAFMRIDGVRPLDAADLESAAVSAYLTGRDDDYLKLLERAHHAWLDEGATDRAVRCAFWIGLRWVFRGELAPGTGWFGRARRILDQDTLDCVEQGYLCLPLAEQHIMGGNFTAAHDAASQAAVVGTKFRDADLVTIALLLQGRIRIREQRIEQGLALLDEAMVAVTAGELSPIVTGLVYCGVIDNCQQVCAFGRAGEWTAALAQWCAGQPQLVAFTGRCLVHRSEIMQLRGQWDDALAEARRVAMRFAYRDEQRVAASAFYQQGEIARLRGDALAAESAYRDASQWGWEPQPGLSLLRLQQGRIEAASAAMRRCVDAATDPLQRLRLLPAHVEIMLAAEDPGEGRAACHELENLTAVYDSELLRAMTAHACGTVELADGNHREALSFLQHARERWREIEAPYLAARTRVELARTCRHLGDHEGAAMELEAARSAFERLGAAPDVARIDALSGRPGADQPHKLTARELQVLRMLATGRTNKSIAAELSLSEKTVDRHVSNIFDKLGVPTRAAATAYAYKHALV